MRGGSTPPVLLTANMAENTFPRGDSMSYNGHRSWNAWNVSMWINNDIDLYFVTLEYVKTMRTKDEAAAEMLENLRYGGIRFTPDGAPYTRTSIREAMRGM